MPAIEVDLPDGGVAEFPEGTPPAVMRDALRKHFGSQPEAASADPAMYQRELAKARASFDQPRVPPPPGIGSPATPEQAATEGVVRQQGIDQQQAAFDASRTPGRRLSDLGAFGLSLPVRAATQGEYGAGDVARKIAGGNSPAAKALTERERSFVEANRTGNYGLNLENAAALGDVTAGIPMLSTMGAVPGQMLRTTAAGVRQLPSELAKLAREDVGSGKIGTPIYDATGNVSHYVDQAGARIAPEARAKAPPTRDEALQAGARINVDMPRMVVGNRVEQSLAGGLSAIPYAGAPVVGAYEKGIGQIGDAAARTVAGLGTPGAEMAGAGAKTGISDWIKTASAEHLQDIYSGVHKLVDPTATRELSATARTITDLEREMSASTGTTARPVIRMVEDAASRPGGLTFAGQADLRTEVGAKLESMKLAPDAGTSEPALKRIYGSLTEDLRATALKAGGPKAAAAFDAANAQAKTIMIKRKMLSGVIGAKGDVKEEDVIRKIHQLATSNAGGNRTLRLVKSTVGPKRWGDAAAELGSRMGIDPSTGQFSGDRFLTAFGKYSDTGKTELFGAARSTFDDIALVASKYRELNRLGNHSGTGRVNAVIKLIMDPKTLLGAAAGAAYMAPGAAMLAAAPTMAGFKAGRSLAWYLSKPQVAGQAGKLIKAYYGVEHAFGSGVNVVGQREAALAQTIRNFAIAVSQETGDSVDDIERALNEKIEAVRRGQEPAR